MYEPLAAGRNVEQRDPLPVDMQPRPSTQIDVAADSDTSEW